MKLTATALSIILQQSITISATSSNFRSPQLGGYGGNRGNGKGGGRGNGRGGGRGNGKGFSKAENRARVINYWIGNNKFNLKHATPRDLAVDAPLDIGNGKGLLELFPFYGKGDSKGKGNGKGKGGNLKGTGKGGFKNGGHNLQSLVDEDAWTNGGDIHQAAGRLMFRIGGLSYVCSATAVTDEDTPGRSVILTAAHCVHDETAFATDFMFIPNQDDGGSDGSDTNCSNDDVFGCWTPSFAVVDNGWLANSPFPGNIPDDYAYLVVNDVDSHQGGPPGIPEALDQAVPAMDIAWSAPVLGSPSYALGYSYSKDPDFRYCVQNLQATGAGMEGYVLEGCGMSGGASGGPWIQTLDASGRGELISVNSYGPRFPPPHYMGGPRLVDNSARCLYEFARTVDEASAGGGGIVVTCADYSDCSTCTFVDGNGPPCDKEEVEVSILTDNYPFETSWDLVNQCTGVIQESAGAGTYQSSNTQYSDTYCVPSAEYKFEIRDSYGDGICCSVGEGSYEVLLNGASVASGGQFDSVESTTFGSCGTGPTPKPTPSPTTSSTTTPTPAPSAATTASPTTSAPTTAAPTTATPTTAAPTTAAPTTAAPTTAAPTTAAPTTAAPTTAAPTTAAPTAADTPTPPPTMAATTANPTAATLPPISPVPTSLVPTSPVPTSPVPTTPTPTMSTSYTLEPSIFATTIAPTPTASAPTTTSSPGNVATFSPILQVPSCDTDGLSCASGILLDGRGKFEQNQPNTLDGCPDGTYGSYHSDESIDSITVTALGVGHLQEGAVAQIDASVFAYGTGAYDTADFYYTADASAPEWVLIGSVPTSRGGLQTLSVQYALPQGNVQGVRVNFRFFGSQSSCSVGGWDDTDDLVFVVGAGSGLMSTYANPTPVAKVSKSIPICSNFVHEERCESARYDGAIVCKWGERGCVSN